MKDLRRLNVEDFAKIIHIAEPKISPDGRSVAYVAVKPNLKENSYRYEIHVMNVKDKELTHTIYSDSKDYSPRWSPNGGELAFLSRRGFKENEKGNSIYYTTFSGEPILIAKRKEGFRNLEFLNERQLIALSKVPVRNIDEDYVDIEDLPIWYDGAGFTEQYRMELFLIDLASREYIQLTAPPRNIISAAPSHTGRKVAYISIPNGREPFRREVRVIDVTDGEELEIVEAKYNFIDVAWSEDDTHLILKGNDRHRGGATHHQIWIVKVEEKAEPINLTGKFGLNTMPAISFDTRGPYRANPKIQCRKGEIYFLVNNAGRSNLYKVNFKGEIKPVTEGDHVIYYYSLARDEEIAILKTDPKHLPEIYVFRRGRIEQLTNLNEWFHSKIKLSKQKHFKVKVSDGVEVDAWYLEPLNLKEKEKYPAILFIHGGPKSSYGYTLNFMHQLFAANNYYVLFANPRGSDGYSEEFADIRGSYGERDYKDLMEVLDEFLKLNPQVDCDRIGVTGISYGGFMTNWIITQTDRFKAAVSENGIADWIADFWASDIGYHFDPDQIGGTPIENMENYVKQSPIYYVKKVKTPLLLIHSMNDYRCFIDQSTALHVMLRLLGKESRLIVFLKGSHGHSTLEKPRHRKKRYKIILDYFNQKLKKSK